MWTNVLTFILFATFVLGNDLSTSDLDKDEIQEHEPKGSDVNIDRASSVQQGGGGDSGGAKDFPILSSPVDFAALKADQELMGSLREYLSRYGISLPEQLVNQVDQTDLCPDHAQDGLKCNFSLK